MSERASTKGRDDELASASIRPEPSDVADSEREKFCCDEVIDNCASEIAGLVGPNDEAQAVEAAVKRALVFMRSLANVRIARAEEALEPFARLAESYFYRYETRPGEWCESHENDPDDRAVYGINRVEITTGDFRRARKVLENRSSGLADATNDPADSDLSSLRKGAEDMRLDIATRALNRIASQQEPHPVSAAFAAMTEIRALVSGSREEP